MRRRASTSYRLLPDNRIVGSLGGLARKDRGGGTIKRDSEVWGFAVPEVILERLCKNAKSGVWIVISEWINNDYCRIVFRRRKLWRINILRIFG
jgi:hypothetical protein